MTTNVEKTSLALLKCMRRVAVPVAAAVNVRENFATNAVVTFAVVHTVAVKSAIVIEGAFAFALEGYVAGAV